MLESCRQVGRSPGEGELSVASFWELEQGHKIDTEGPAVVELRTELSMVLFVLGGKGRLKNPNP